MRTKVLATLLILTFSLLSFAQSDTIKLENKTPEKKSHWYELLSLRGYAQLRYNRLLETNSKLRCDQCDRSIGENGGFSFRRARFVFSGQVHPRVFVYVQFDIASSALTSTTVISQHFLQIRDLYGDIYLEDKKRLRLRAGLSKIPYGFDNIQSSQNRIAFDRSDPINSAIYNERDIGLILYYTPVFAQTLYKKISDKKLKGSGDYGLVGLGVFNGQTANRVEANNALHTVLRVNSPFELSNGQLFELGVQAYSGYFGVKEVVSNNVSSAPNILDRRVGGTLVIYPQPLGFQGEYNIGDGPEFNNNKGIYSIERKHLKGGYGQVMFMKKISEHTLVPYYRFQYYSGGKKIETDARSYEVTEHEIGIEWSPISAIEITTAYMISDRAYRDSSTPNYHEKGNLLRLQLQYNY